ncbi:type IV secretion system protein [uncultured Massilia sp.]|uniref:type IV secretion system protein n=1 Tax=uncultured Massilia sp. TaxID=169973 RepID=UPI0025D20CB8|nr:type IV secretion system protein [uncultured Massilia sp.]
MIGFPPTTKFFDAWFGKVVNHMLLTVFMDAVTTLSMRIAKAFVSQVAAAADTSHSLAKAFEFALLSITLIVVTWQIPNIASGIAGGAAVSGAREWATAMVASMRNGGASSGSSFSSKSGSS